MSDEQHSNFTATIRIQMKSWTRQKVALQILRLLAEDAHLEIKRSYEGDPSRSEWSEAKRNEAEQEERRLGSPSTSWFEKGPTQADLRIGVGGLNSFECIQKGSKIRGLGRRAKIVPLWVTSLS
jgi:hypothetical protein